jgi:hypothetical protein
MPYHQSSAVSVATLVTAATVIVIGYRIGRAHAAWRDVRSAKRDVPAKRRIAWRHTRPLFFGGLFLVLTFAAAAYDASH